MDSNLTDFLHQIPIGFLLAPVIFGGLYLVLMVYIFRRAAARRRARAIAMGELPSVSPEPSIDKPLSFFPNRMPNRLPMASPLPDLPEPDLDSLSSSAPSLPEPDLHPDNAIAPMPAANWLAMTPVDGTTAESSALEVVHSESKEFSMQPSKQEDPTGAVEVMRVWRDLSDGTLLIELDGRRFRSPREIGSAELARRFINVVRELWTMVNTGLPSRTSDSVAATDLGMGNSRVRAGLLNNPPPIPEPELKAPGMLRTLGRAAASQPAARPAGIADAVEDYLQFKLSNTAQFQQRSIHVRPAFDGGVRIEVDGRSYNGVGDVVDPDVRDFLSATLREWEARQ